MGKDELIKMTSIVRIDYDSAQYSKVLGEIILIGHKLPLKDVTIREKVQRHFHVTIHLRYNIPLAKAIKVVEDVTSCDRKYLDWVLGSQGFSMRQSPDYRDITADMEKSLFEYFVNNGCPENWINWFAYRDTTMSKGNIVDSYCPIDYDNDTDTENSDEYKDKDNEDEDEDEDNNDVPLVGIDDLIPVDNGGR